jgi:hypothetical protein
MRTRIDQPLAINSYFRLGSDSFLQFEHSFVGADGDLELELAGTCDMALQMNVCRSKILPLTLIKISDELGVAAASDIVMVVCPCWRSPTYFLVQDCIEQV